MRPVTGALLALLSLSCEKTKAAAAPGGASSALVAVPDAAPRDAGVDAPAEEPAVTDLWTRAKDGEADERARLARGVGSDMLVAALADPSRRMAALGALAFTDDFTPLPALARQATAGTDAEAAAALDSAEAITSRVLPSTDREDALELREGETLLAALAKDGARPAPRRALAASCLRLLADRGWLAPGEIPAGIDGH